MSKFVVIHHAHHADEGVYRLVFANVVDETRLVNKPNPDHDPEDQSSTPFLISRESYQIPVSHHEVVWAADDERWQGREPEDIAAEQRQIVKDAITKQIAEVERAEVERANATTDLGSAGTEL